ncbi:MAG: ADP-ribosylglycohydrolase family protein [Bacteroidales bacterium]
MPNGGPHHCGNCRHFRNDICSIRNEEIEITHWTTCHNWNTSKLTPAGVIFAIVGEVKNKAVAYGNIPYYNGLRVDTFQEGNNDTSVAWESKDGRKLVFKDVKEYLNFYDKEQKKKKQYIMGAIIGDIIGSVYEWYNVKTTDFKLFSKQTDFTDDSVLTFATMDCILNDVGYAKVYQTYGRNFPGRGYGSYFASWVYNEDLGPYQSFGNGSAMRVSPVGWAYNSIDEVLKQAKRSAEVSHNHPEGIKGAQATASAIFLARTGKSKIEIKEFIDVMFDYNLNRSIKEIRPIYQYDVTCQGSVPEAIIAFLESTDYESAIRLAISIGGDSDTIACITGGIAEAFYKEIPEYIVENALRVLPAEIIKLIEEFSNRYREGK